MKSIQLQNPAIPDPKTIQIYDGRIAYDATTGIHALLYVARFGNLWIRFWKDDIGAYTDIDTGVNSSVAYSAVILLSGSTLHLAYMWLGHTPSLFLLTYSLSGSPLPTAFTLLSTDNVGSSRTQAVDMTLTSAGSLVIACTGEPGTSEAMSVAYKSVGGSLVWNSLPLESFNVRYYITTVRQHPVTGEIWLFGAQEGTFRVSTWQFTESSGVLGAPVFTENRYVMGEHGFIGKALTSPTEILLPVMDMPYELYSSGFGWYISILHILSDGSEGPREQMAHSWDYAPPQLAVDAGGTRWLAYFRMDETVTGATAPLGVANSSDGFLGFQDIGPAFNTLSGTDNTPFSYASDAPIYAVWRPDGVYLCDLSSTPTPPLVLPTVSIATPANGGSVPAKQWVTIQALAQAGTNPIGKVVITVNGNVVASSSTATVTTSWLVPPGKNKKYQIQASVTDSQGNQGLSSVVDVTSH